MTDSGKPNALKKNLSWFAHHKPQTIIIFCQSWDN